ncbi:MAG: pilin [bacterium]|nr:pilin [bacterium]
MNKGILITFLIFIALTGVVFAEEDQPYRLIVPFDGTSNQEVANPVEYIFAFYNFALGAGGLAAVAIIVFAGLKWTTSAGNVSAQSEAKDMILNAILGIVMLLGSILILRTIDPKLTTLELETLKPVLDPAFNFSAYNEDMRKAWTAANQSKTIQNAERDRLAEECKNGCPIDKQIALYRAIVAGQKDVVTKAAIDVQAEERAVADKQKAYDKQIGSFYNPYSQGDVDAKNNLEYEKQQLAAARAKLTYEQNALSGYQAQLAALEKQKATAK